MLTQNSSPLAPPQTTILLRMVTQAVLLTTFIIILLSTVSFIITQSLLQQSILNELSSLVSSSEERLEQKLLQAQERGVLLSGNNTLRRALTQKAAQTELEDLLASMQKDEPALKGLEVYDTSSHLLGHAGIAVGLGEDVGAKVSHRTVIDRESWQWFDVFAPLSTSASPYAGTIALRYAATEFMEPLLRLAPAVGPSSKITFSLQQDDTILLIHPDAIARLSSVLYLNAADKAVQQMPVVRAMQGEEGMEKVISDEGKNVLIAYRRLPSLGWGLSVQLDRTAALQQVQSLATSLAIIGVLLILLAITVAYLLASRLTQPLRDLTQRVLQLRPGHWQIKQSIHTKDEVEMLDRVIADLSLRLQRVYKNQEQEIENRTEALKKQYALDRTILNGIDQGVITVDPKGMVTGVNAAACRLLLRKAEDAIGLPGTELLDLREHGGNALKITHPIEICLNTHQQARSPINAHWSIMRKDTSMLPVLMTVSPLMQAGQLFGAIIVLEDVTEERHLDYVKSEFITLASHQLRTPLSAMRWYIEMLQDEQKDFTTDQQGYLKEIENGLGRMDTLLNALLRASRLEGEDMKPECQAIDVTAMMHDVEKDCKMLGTKADMKCTLVTPDKPVILHTDPTLLRIVLQNLVSNAVKYSPKGTTIHLNFSVQDKTVTFSVQDEGLGIPVDDQKRIFERFFRAKNVRKMDTDGSGIGLYITKSIVERLGGTITFKSAENQGTTFTVTLPIQEAEKKTE